MQVLRPNTGRASTTLLAQRGAIKGGVAWTPSSRGTMCLGCVVVVFREDEVDEFQRVDRPALIHVEMLKKFDGPLFGQADVHASNHMLEFLQIQHSIVARIELSEEQRNVNRLDSPCKKAPASLVRHQNQVSTVPDACEFVADDADRDRHEKQAHNHEETHDGFPDGAFGRNVPIADGRHRDDGEIPRLPNRLDVRPGLGKVDEC
mmetsp:Transcript_104489/g.294468  ORF Transcript_104489/g.294468 Transcript_104489/m.294468 type:complete len:205 (-) Transcript_104489:1123-1737(-)